MNQIPIHLLPREPPLEPVGIVARGGAAEALARSTARRVRGGHELRAAIGPGWLVVLGEQESLPWADGCTYLGRDGRLLVPTTARISPSADLVAAALAPTAGLVVVLEGTVLHGEVPTRIVDLSRLADS